MAKAKGKVKNEGCSRLMMILMVVCVVLSLATLVLVSYDKLVRNDNNQPVVSGD